MSYSIESKFYFQMIIYIFMQEMELLLNDLKSYLIITFKLNKKIYYFIYNISFNLIIFFSKIYN